RPLRADGRGFLLPDRLLCRRPDLRLRRGRRSGTDWTTVDGLPVTRPRRIAFDLRSAREVPGAVGHIVAEALRANHDDPTALARALSGPAGRFGLRREDGPALLRWLLDLAAAPERNHWLSQTHDMGIGTSQS